MRSSRKHFRRLVDIIVIVMVTEVIVMMLLPYLAPNATGINEAFIDALLLSLIAAPCIYLRFKTSSKQRRSEGRGEFEVRTADQLNDDHHFRGLVLITASILIVGVAASIGTGGLVAKQQRQLAESELYNLNKQIASTLLDWTNRPIYALRGARGLFAASEEVHSDEFANYVKRHNYNKEFPGTKIFGMIKYAKANPEQGLDERWIVQYAEPASLGHSAIGTNLGTIEELVDELKLAVHTGEPVLAERARVPGVPVFDQAMYWLLPVYTRDSNPTNEDERIEALEGVVFATFDPEGLKPMVNQLVGSSGFYSVTQVLDNGSVLLSNEPAELASQPNPHGHLETSQSEMHIGSQDWMISITPTSSFAKIHHHNQPILIVFVGSLLSMTIAGMIWLLGNSRTRAVDMANQMTSRIRNLSLVAEKTTNVVMIMDEQRRIQWVNTAFTVVTGYTSDEVVGRVPGSFLQSENTDPETINAINNAIEQGIGFRGEVLNRAKDGREYWLDTDIQPIYDSQNKLKGYITVEVDLSEQKAIERKTLQAMAEAEAANEAKGRFLASMSHEIRTPLNGVIGFADLLQRGADSGDESVRAEWVGVIHTSGKHLLNLLNDVLDLSKLDADHTDIAIHPCNPRKAISEAVILLNSRAQEQGISLGVTIDDDVPESIRTDATRIRQIVMNIVSNAVKFTRVGGVKVHVSVSDESKSPRLRVRVSDTGIGMNEEQLDQLFKPFQQGDKTIAKRFGGTGLGLSISKRLAERLGGNITVTSQQGVGSVFTVTIDATPLLPGESIPTHTQAREGWGENAGDDQFPLDGACVLVADDVEANRQVCSLFLSKAGATVVTVNDGSEAVTACKGEVFDLILMDVQMPVLNGLDASEQIRELGVTTPILALTAFSSGGDRVGCLASGMNDFLSKPIDSAILIQSSAQWIKKNATGTQDDAQMQIDNDLWDPELIKVVKDWLEQLSGKIELAQLALEGEDLDPIARIGHAILGSGGTLGMSEFNQPSALLEKAALAGNKEKARMHLEEIRKVREDAIARFSRLSAA